MGSERSDATGGTRRILLYDGGCLECSRIAGLTQTAADCDLEIASLDSAEGAVLLESAFPSGWPRRPYLVVTDGQAIVAHAGLGMAWQFLRIAGPLRSMAILWALGRDGASHRPNRQFLRTASLHRRRFVIMLMGLVAGMLPVILQTSNAAACQPDCSPGHNSCNRTSSGCAGGNNPNCNCCSGCSIGSCFAVWKCYDNYCGAYCHSHEYFYSCCCQPICF
jgi:predicted DCC family thiol-disulfide oxidoreductase YuxK